MPAKVISASVSAIFCPLKTYKSALNVCRPVLFIVNQVWGTDYTAQYISPALAAVVEHHTHQNEYRHWGEAEIRKRPAMRQTKN